MNNHAKRKLAQVRSTIFFLSPCFSSDWSSVVASAVATDHEHTQKLVFVCWHDMKQLAKLDRNDPRVGKRDTLARFYRFCATKRVIQAEEKDGDY